MHTTTTSWIARLRRLWLAILLPSALVAFVLGYQGYRDASALIQQAERCLKANDDCPPSWGKPRLPESDSFALEQRASNERNSADKYIATGVILLLLGPALMGLLLVSKWIWIGTTPPSRRDLQHENEGDQGPTA